MADYRGISISAAPGLHEAVFSLLQRHLPGGGHRVLDLGCGAGAFLQRLLDHGYVAEGVDIQTDQFRATGTLHKRDLNVGMDGLGRWDAITAVEVIEHLENPRHLFRVAARHLVPGGCFLVTTPNIESVVSRTYFLITGRYWWFDEEYYHSSGHITPLTEWQLDQMAAETSFKLHSTCAGPAPQIGWRLRFLSRLLRPLMRGAQQTDIRICLYVRTVTESGPTLAGDVANSSEHRA